ncbi:MAG: Murein hydrolase activator NlpD [Paracidovorax wautersii]|uniref:Murein hydrolase activator NlpD n=1 Tax=Paracidovorax wautersii TaxID=1177982 RepID=A0A7V8FMS3_9BURK|nr:MAG: Murein hydrolase activator NlpD [Paracidovorax wautersii]
MTVRAKKLWWTLPMVLALAACSSTSLTKAPVEDRGGVTAAALPGAENAGKPGYYTVQRGDNLYRIALNNSQSQSNLIRWNNLANPNALEVGQVLRVVPPANESAPAARGVVVTPVPQPSSSGTPPTPAPAQPAAAPTGGPDEIVWIWPTQGGTVIATFNANTNKGLGISGKAGDPVYAAADGRVVYAGSGLRGYGNLIILKHNNTYLSAYAHNQTLLVKEDQAVKQGQKIAEMGSSDSDRVKLHFEIRRQGQPVDPMRYLPAR